MTAPHLASDDLAINAAQARIRDNLEARARACFDAAIARPSLDAVEAVRRALMALHHQWVAGMEQERPIPHRERDELDDLHEGYRAEAFARAQSDFGRNPAPVVSNAGQERRPVPCVPGRP